MKAVTSFRTLSQAQALRLALEAEGIRATVADEQAVSLVGGSVAVFVFDDADYARARAVAARLEGSVALAADEASRRCPRCHAENPANFTTCWSCQADLSDKRAAAPPADATRDPPTTTATAARNPAYVPSTSADDRRRLILELGIVLLLMFWSFPLRVWERVNEPGGPTLGGREPLVVQISFTAFYIGFAALLLYLIWQRARSLEPAGLGRLRWSRELLFGLVILVATVGVNFAAGALASAAGLQSWSSDAPPRVTGVFYPAYLLAAACYEEVVFRAYLIDRLETLVGRTAPAVLVSALLFALRHVASPARSLALLGTGLLWGAIFASVRRLPRLVFAHWAWNLVVLYGHS